MSELSNRFTSRVDGVFLVELCLRIEFSAPNGKYVQFVGKMGDFISYLEENEIPMAEFRERLAYMNATLVSMSAGCNNLRGMSVDAIDGAYWEKTTMKMDLWTNTESPRL